jgi:hypothetical protein
MAVMIARDQVQHVLGLASSLVGQAVSASGVVKADTNRGFEALDRAGVTGGLSRGDDAVPT